MTIRKHANRFQTTLAVAIDDTDTSIQLTSVTGLPAIGVGEEIWFTVEEGALYETMIGTDDASSPTYTVTRAQEGTTAQSFTTAATVSVYVTKDSIDRKADITYVDASIAALDADDIDDTSTTNKFTNASDISKLASIESNADVTDATNVKSSLDGMTLSTITPASGDYILAQDASDSYNLKAILFSSFAGGGSATVVDGTTNQIVSTFDTVDTYTLTLADDTVMPGNGGMILPQGGNGSRGSNAFGRIRANYDVTVENGQIEYNDSSGWYSLQPHLSGVTVTGATIATGDLVLFKDISASNVLRSATAQSIANLALTSGATGTLPVNKGGTGQTSYTNGQLLIGNTTGNTLTKATLTPGGGINIVNSGGGITLSTNGLHLLGSATASNSAQLDFTSLISSTYDTYMIVGNDIRVQNDDVPLLIRTSSNNGSSYDSGASDYYAAGVLVTSAASTVTGVAFNGTTYMFLNGAIGNASGECGSFTAYLTGVNGANYKHLILANSQTTGAGGVSFFNVAQMRKSTSTINAFRIYAETGNIVSGTVYLYGLAKA